MNKIINLIWPFADFVYILQLEDYDTPMYFKWIWGRLFKRNLQYIGKIDWTRKAQVLTSISVGLYLGLICFWWQSSLIYLLAIIVLLTFFIPILVGLANIVWLPFDLYLKQQLIARAKAKLTGMQNCIVVAIAGSYGKSTVRYFTTQLLSPDYVVHTPKENHNTLYSLSTDIVYHLQDQTKFYFVEMGEYHQGDFRKYIDLLDPEIIVVTGIGPQHITSFGSQEAIDNEFKDLIEITKDKIHLLNADNEGVNRVFGEKISSLGQFNQKYFDDNFGQAKIEAVKVPQLKQCASAAVTLAAALGVNKETIFEHIALLHPVDGRMNITEQNGITIIDDTYNINPDSAAAALRYLASLKGRKIIVTGGIVDQGENSDKANIDLADMISQHCDVAVVAKTIFSPLIVDTIRERNKMCQVIESVHPSQTPGILKEMLQPGDNVLLQNELPDLYWH